MKKSVLNGMFVALLVGSLGLAGCQQTKKTESKTTTSSKVVNKKSTSQSKDKKKKTKTASSTTESTTKQTTETKEKTTTSQTPQTEKTKTSTPAQSTILDALVGKNFGFSSGAGGWGTSLSIGPNGTFSGNYHDSDMGLTGPGYPGGTISASTVSGNFTKLHQISSTLYVVYLENLQYEKPVGSSEIRDNVKYEYTEAYGISKNTRMAIYPPGTPISALPEEFRVYSGGRIPEGSQTLPFYVIQGDMEGFFMEYH